MLNMLLLQDFHLSWVWSDEMLWHSVYAQRRPFKPVRKRQTGLERLHLNFKIRKTMNYSYLLYCVLIGYLFGNVLFAELIGKIKGKSTFENGSGNPGMTNSIHVLGLSSGILVLLGDILKTLLAYLLCRWLFPSLGSLSALYSGMGCMLGHCFPFWHHFQGGKGVTVVCAAYILYAPIPGIVALACGGICILLKKGVKVAAAIIPLVFLVLMLFSFSWLTFLPALFMGSLLAYLNLRPNRLQTNLPAPGVEVEEEAVPAITDGSEKIPVKPESKLSREVKKLMR